MKTVLFLAMSLVTCLPIGSESLGTTVVVATSSPSSGADGPQLTDRPESVGRVLEGGSEGGAEHWVNETQVSSSVRPERLTERPRPAADEKGSGGRSRGKAHGRTEPPMLGYIFDSHASLAKHHHHDHRWGPHFEETHVANSSNVTVHVATSATLNCRISLLQDKTVSWVRRGSSSDPPMLLTVGHVTYSGDARYKVNFQYPNNWRLVIGNTTKNDEGTYECQISTHPPKVIRIHLLIDAPEVLIVDEQGETLLDKYYEVASTIQLTCLVRHVALHSGVVSWTHGDNMLNYDVTRGGISVRTDLSEEGATSTLSVARINKSDGGDYSCSISPTERATVTVHVLNGESIAELHDGSGSVDTLQFRKILFCLLVFFVLS